MIGNPRYENSRFCQTRQHSPKKTLRFKPDLEKLESSIRSLTRAIENLQGIADDLRAELASLLASVEAVDIRDYTSYSYRELSSAASIAAQILNRPDNTLEELYSALVDVEINIDLLEDWGMEDGELDQLFNANEMPKVHLDPRPNSTPPHDVVTEEVTPEVIYPSHTVFPSDHTPAFPPDSTTPNSFTRYPSASSRTFAQWAFRHATTTPSS